MYLNKDSCKKFSKFNNKNTNNSIRKCTKDRQFTREDIWTADKHIIPCLTPSHIWERQGTVTRRNHCTSIGIVKGKSCDDARCHHGCGETGPLTHFCGKCKSTDSLENSLAVYKNLSLLDGPVVTFLTIYPRKDENSVHTKIWTRVFTVVLFTRANTGNNPNVPQQ